MNKKYHPETSKIRIGLILNDLSINKAAKRLRMAPCDFSKMIHGHQAFFAKRSLLAKLLGVPVETIFPDSGRRAS